MWGSKHPIPSNLTGTCGAPCRVCSHRTSFLFAGKSGRKNCLMMVVSKTDTNWWLVLWAIPECTYDTTMNSCARITGSRIFGNRKPQQSDNWRQRLSRYMAMGARWASMDQLRPRVGRKIKGKLAKINRLPNDCVILPRVPSTSLMTSTLSNRCLSSWCTEQNLISPRVCQFNTRMYGCGCKIVQISEVVNFPLIYCSSTEI